MDQENPKSSGQPKILYIIVAVLVALGAGLGYFSQQREAALRQEVSSCGEAGCKSLAEQVQGLTDRLSAPSPANELVTKVADLERDILGLKTALAAAEEGRDQLAAQVVACGQEGCLSLATRLAKAEKEVQELKHQQKSLHEQVVALGQDNRMLREQLAKEFSTQTGQRMVLKEIIRIGPFEVGSFTPDDHQLAELRERLAPYKNTPLLVVGIADARQYQGPSADLKQLGLMLARAQVVKAMGYEVYYQVRQNDPGVRESRGVIVYQMSMQTKVAMAAPSDNLSMSMPTFYTAE